MDHPLPIPHPEVDAPPDRQSRILDAAERCIVRSGFHRTTMQDVAAEAGMSPGNLYRYFRSKDAILMGLTERDRARVGRDFDAFDGTADLAAAFQALARKHFADEPRHHSILCLEIWAEATRNAEFATISHAFDEDIIGRMARLFQHGQANGLVAEALDADALAVLVITLANGLFVRRAVSPRFDAERELGAVMAVIKAAFEGRIDLSRTTGGKPASESGA